MAVNHNHNQGMSSLARRWFFGANVVVAIVLVLMILVAINWLGQRHDFRRDVTGGFSSYAVSERTRQFVDKAGGDFAITTVYTSDEPDMDREKYLPKLRDYTSELAHYDGNIKVEHLHTGNERAELRDRILKKFGSGVDEYQEIVQSTLATWTESKNTIAELQQRIRTLLAPGSWLADFSALANIEANLRSDLELLDKARSEVNDLIKSEGIPRYQEANDKIKETNETVRGHLDQAQNWGRAMYQLVRDMTRPDSTFAGTTGEKAMEMLEGARKLQEIAGPPDRQEVPDDPKPLLKEYATAADQLATVIAGEISRIDKFVGEHPAIQLHPEWNIQQDIFVMQLPAILNQSSETLTGNSQALRGYLTRDDIPLDQMQLLVRKAREAAAQQIEMLQIWADKMSAIIESFRKVDPASMAFLADVHNTLLTDTINNLGNINDKIENLPELKLDEIAEKLGQDNIVIVENEKDIKVLTFDEVWPPAAPMLASMDDTTEQRRVFDGDTAIGEAMFSLTSEKPLAPVVIVAYETQPPPQMRQFQQPNVGPVPLQGISKLREQLTAAGFIVKDWNLGAEGQEAQSPPTFDEETQLQEPIYLFLPPAPKPMPNPYMRQTPPSFGPRELARVKNAIKDGARTLWLTNYQFSRMPDTYPYAKLLEENWGIDPLYDHRIIYGVVDTNNPERYFINFERWNYMRLNNFTDQVIGAPFKARRMLMWEVCPIEIAEQVPEHVKLDPVLTVPPSNDVWAQKDIRPIIRAFFSGEQGTTFAKGDETLDGPFPVIVAGENSETQARTVVMGNAMSYRDDYLSRRVVNTRGEQQVVVTTAPPVENLELLTNALYWLSGDLGENLIAAGPAEVPLVPHIEARTKTYLWGISAGWAFVVLIAGGLIMLIRKR